MKIKTTEIPYYKIEIAGCVIGEFRETDTWKNFVEMKSSDGESIIALKDNCGLNLDELFGIRGGKGMVMIAASPDVHARCQEALKYACKDCEGMGIVSSDNNKCETCDGSGVDMNSFNQDDQE